MRIIAFAFLGAFAPVAATAQTPFKCELSPDRKSVNVAVTNPYDQETHCTVNCHFSPQSGSTISITCANTVPGKATDFALCRRERDSVYGAMLPTSNAECIKPLSQGERDDDSGDGDIEKLKKEGLDALKKTAKAELGAD